MNGGLELLRHLSSQHEFVSAKSTSLHTACQHLLEEQTALSELAEELSLRLVYFTDADRIAQKLQTPAAVANTVNSDSFLQILDRIDECYSHVIDHVRTTDLLEKLTDVTENHLALEISSKASSLSYSANSRFDPISIPIAAKLQPVRSLPRQVPGLPVSGVGNGSRPRNFDAGSGQDCRGACPRRPCHRINCRHCVRPLLRQVPHPGS